MEKIIKKILKEQSELPTMDFYHISIGENWYPFSNSNEERWSKGYGYQAKLTPQKLIV